MKRLSRQLLGKSQEAFLLSLQGIVFNSYDFQAILHKDRIRGNNKYHYRYKAFGSNSYSPELVDYIANKINSNQNYLVDARAWFKQNPPKKKDKSA